MRHPLNWLLRFVPESDRRALLGDIEEEYHARIRPARSWPRAKAWYIGQLIAAAWWFGRRHSMTTSLEPRSNRRVFDLSDVRYALRRWRRRPGFPLTAALTLGLGIGAATAMFSVVDAVLLRPLPWPEPDRLVTIHAVDPARRADPAFATTWNRLPVTYPGWETLRQGASFADVAVWAPPTLGMTLDRARTELAQTMNVSSNFLPMLGVRVLHGRNFTKEDDTGDTWSLILAYEAWQRHFGGRPEIVGQPSDIAYASDTHTPPWTVVGVLEPGFSFEGYRPDLLRSIGGNARSTFPIFRALGRLAPGVSVEAATSEAAALLLASQPGNMLGGRVVPLQEEQVGSSGRPLWLLFGAASVLLLVACANVAGLLLGENRARRHETAIRLALGITPGGIVRQLVVEHAMLAVAGAAAGLLLAAWLTQALVALAPVELPRLGTVRVDRRVAMFALGAGGATLLAFGLAPALSLARTRAAEMLAGGARESSPARHVAQRTVVAAEIAMAAVLVVGAGLLGETLFRLTSQPLGFDPSNLVVVRTQFTGSDIPADWRRGTRGPGGTQSPNLNSGPPLAERVAAIRLARTEAVVERLSALPGVVQAAGGTPPFSGRPESAGLSIRIDGRSPHAGDRAAFRSAGAGFATTVGVPVLAGRDLVPTDGRTGVLVSREFERRYFPDGAVGRRFTREQLSSQIVHEVVGVVADLKHTYAEDPLPRVYGILDSGTFLVRTAGAPEPLLAAIRQAFADVDPQMVVTSTTTMTAALAEVIAAERFRAMLSTSFAGAALLLAAIGLYGVAARRVADRWRELGIRVALGARPENLRALVLGDGVLTAGIGLAIGLPIAFAASQVTRVFLFGVSPTAPHVFLLAALVLTAVALAATLLPARRAGRIDPMVALRE